MPNYLQHIYRTTTKRGKVVAVLDEPITTQDHDADAFIVTVSDAVFSGGMAYGDFVRADGKTIPLSGRVSGDTATVILAPNCYTVPGRFFLTVKVEAAGSKTTYLQVEGYAKLSSTDEYAVAGDGSAPIDVILEAAEKAEQVLSAVSGKAPAIYVDASGDMVTITDGADGMPVASLITHIEPVQEGSGDPSPDNVRPISGWDSVSATRMGKNLANLFDFNRTLHSVVIAAKDGIVTMNGTSSSDSTSVLLWKSTLKPGTYTLSHKVLSGSMTGAAATASVLSGAGVRTRLNAPAATFTVEEETEYSFNIVLASSTVTYDNFIFSVQLEKGDTATDFEPPNMQTLTAALPETLYGFDKNWTTGLVTVDKACKVFDGTETITNAGGEMSFASPLGIVDNSDTINCVCSAYRAEPRYRTFDNRKADGYQGVSATARYIRFVDNVNANNDVDAFKTLLATKYAAGTPVTVVYKLATPYTIQLTPQQLSTLKGVNNIWNDAGATEVTYAADTKMYIDQKIAAIAAAIV